MRAGSSRRHVPWRALVASVVVHAVALLAIALWPATPEAPVVIEDERVVMIEIEAATPVVAPPADAPSPEVARPLARAVARKPAKDGIAATPATAPAPPSPEDTAAVPTLLRMRVPTLGDLHPPIEGVVVAPPSPPASEAPRQRRWDRTLAEAERYERGRANLQHDGAPPVVFDLLRDLQQAFRPAQPMVEHEQPEAPTRRRALKRFARSWLGGYIDSLRAMNEGGDGGGRIVAPRGADGNLFSAQRQTERARAEPIEGLTCEVCVITRRDAAPTFELRRRSASGAFDRMALAAVAQTVEHRDIAGGLAHGRACYQFQASVDRALPIFPLMCGFDEAALSASCVYWFKKTFRTRVQLTSVELEGG